MGPKNGWASLWFLENSLTFWHNWTVKAETVARKKDFFMWWWWWWGVIFVFVFVQVCCINLIIYVFQQQGLQRILHNQPEPVCCSWPPSPSSGSQSSNFKSTSPSLSSTLLYYKHYVGWLYMPMILQFVGSKQWQWIALLLKMTTSNIL